MKYQDYVIKDGKFVGRFEEMYQSFEDPWKQSDPEISCNIARLAVAHYIKKYKIQSVVEFGCGLGDASANVKKFVGDELNYLGVDISDTAIAEAKARHADLSFVVDDCSNIANYSEFQAIFFSEITWYLLEDRKLDEIFLNIQEHFSSAGEKFFIHNLVFYKGDLQKYGNHYFTTLEEFISFCPFELVGTTVINDLANDTCVDTCSIFKI